MPSAWVATWRAIPGVGSASVSSVAGTIEHGWAGSRLTRLRLGEADGGHQGCHRRYRGGRAEAEARLGQYRPDGAEVAASPGAPHRLDGVVVGGAVGLG